MSRSLQNLEPQSGKLERIAVFHPDEFVLGLSLRTQPYLCTATVA